MIDCITPEDFAYFLTLVQHIVEFISDNIVVLHTTGNGDVYWEYNEDINQFCKIPPIKS